MNKKIITFAIAAIGLCSVAANAQTADSKATSQANAEQQVDNKMYKPQKFTDFAFEGILLDVNQQAAIDQINQQYQQQLAPRGDRGQKQKCDSAKCEKKACPANADKNLGNRKGGPRDNSWRRQYAAQVKEVLTPEQYVTFLENIAFYTPDHQGMHNRPDKKMNKEERSKHQAKADHRRGDKRGVQQELKAQGSNQQTD